MKAKMNNPERKAVSDRDPKKRLIDLSLRVLRLARRPDIRDSYSAYLAARNVSPKDYERLAPVEDEFKVLGLGKDREKALHQYLEKERDYVLQYDGTVTDEYYELDGGKGAAVELGDVPRIRHKVGVELNKTTGKLEEVNYFEFSIKAKVDGKEGAGKHLERGLAVFHVTDYGSGVEAEQTAHEAAVAEMRRFVRENLKADDARLQLWRTWKKHRTSHKGDFVTHVTDSGEKTYGVGVDSDTQESMTTVFPEETTVSNDDREKIVSLYRKAGTKPPAEFNAKGAITLPKGYVLEIPLGSVPTYAEFEVVYPHINEDDSVSVKAQKEQVIRKLRARRDNLYQELVKEKIIDPEKGAVKIIGNLGAVLDRYDIPDKVGMRRDSQEALTGNTDEGHG